MSPSATTSIITPSVAKAVRVAVEHQTKMDHLGITPHLEALRRANEKRLAAQLQSVSTAGLVAQAVQIVAQNRLAVDAARRAALAVTAQPWSPAHRPAPPVAPLAPAAVEAMAAAVEACDPMSSDLEAMDLAMAGLLLGVATLVYALTEDGLATALVILLTYLIFASGPSRAVLILLLRDMQGRD